MARLLVVLLGLSLSGAANATAIVRYDFDSTNSTLSTFFVQLIVDAPPHGSFSGSAEIVYPTDEEGNVVGGPGVLRSFAMDATFLGTNGYTTLGAQMHVELVDPVGFVTGLFGDSGHYELSFGANPVTFQSSGTVTCQSSVGDCFYLYGGGPEGAPLPFNSQSSFVFDRNLVVFDDFLYGSIGAFATAIGTTPVGDVQMLNVVETGFIAGPPTTPEPDAIALEVGALALLALVSREWRPRRESNARPACGVTKLCRMGLPTEAAPRRQPPPRSPELKSTSVSVRAENV